MKESNCEIELRWLDVETRALEERILRLGGTKIQDHVLDEWIFYDPAGRWQTDGRLIRLRGNGDEAVLTFKQHRGRAGGPSAIEVETAVGSIDATRAILKSVGLVEYRWQQKHRLSYQVGPLRLDFDTWPGVPTYLEIEGLSIPDIRDMARRIGLPPAGADSSDAREVLRQYGIDLDRLRVFTFDDQIAA